MTKFLFFLLICGIIIPKAIDGEVNVEACMKQGAGLGKCCVQHEDKEAEKEIQESCGHFLKENTEEAQFVRIPE
jgi:hypothetical protein